MKGVTPSAIRQRRLALHVSQGRLAAIVGDKASRLTVCGVETGEIGNVWIRYAIWRALDEIEAQQSQQATPQAA